MARRLGRNSRFWLHWRLPNGRSGKLGPFPEVVARPLSARFGVTLLEDLNDPPETPDVTGARRRPWTRPGNASQ
jgi:hypothetical protein